MNISDETYNNLNCQYIFDSIFAKPWFDYGLIKQTISNAYDSFDNLQTMTDMYNRSLSDNNNTLLRIGFRFFAAWWVYRFISSFFHSIRVHEDGDDQIIKRMLASAKANARSYAKAHQIKKRNRAFDKFAREVKKTVQSNISNGDKIIVIETSMDKLTEFLGKMKRDVIPKRNLFRESRNRKRVMKNQWANVGE